MQGKHWAQERGAHQTDVFCRSSDARLMQSGDATETLLAAIGESPTSSAAKVINHEQFVTEETLVMRSELQLRICWYPTC